MPGNGRLRRAGHQRGDAGQRGDHVRAGLGLPPGVHDRAAAAADVLVVPEPGLGVDRLTDRAEQPQAGQVEARRDVLAPLHERPDHRRRGVEDRDAVLLDDLPPAAAVRGLRRALVHDRRRPVGQRPVDDVAVAGDPADVGRRPEDVVVGLEVEGRPVRVGDLGQVAAGGVQDALRLRRRPGRVHDVERVLGVEGLAARARSTAARRRRPTRGRGPRSTRRPGRCA